MKARSAVPSLVLLLPPQASATMNRAELAEQVRAELLYSWKAYERYAWGHDELRPVSKQPRD